MKTAGAQSPPNWNLYEGYTSAPLISFKPMNYKDGKKLETRPAQVSLSMSNGTGSGSLTHGFTMDTGSTGIIASPDNFTPGPKDKAVGTGFQYYSSSGRQENGTFYETEVVINDRHGKPVATSRVTVLQITSVTCRFLDKGCQPTKPGEQPKGIAYMGVGFDRGVSSMQPPAGYTNTNPFTNVIKLADGRSMDTYRQGYRITNKGVTLGLSSQTTSGGYGFVKLQPNTAPGQPNPSWLSAPMTISVNGVTGNGNILPDSGIDYAFLTPPGGVTLPTQACPKPPGGKNCVVPKSKTEIEVYLPGQTSPIGTYRFNTDQKGNPTKPTVTTLVADGPAIFLNTGRQFYAGFDYVYDAVGGYVGYRWTDPAGASGASSASLALTGNVTLKDGFSSDMPTYLMGPVTFLEQGTGTLSGVISGSGPLTIGSGQVDLTAVNTYTGGTVIAAGATLGVQADSGMGATAGGLTFTGGTLRALDTLTIARNVTLAANGTFDTNGHDITVGTAIGGAGGLIKDGLGILTLSGANAYAGGTTVNKGTLRLATGASLPGTGALTVNGGTFDLNGNTVTVGALAGSGGTIALGNGRLVDDGAGTTTLDSVITGTGGLTKSGPGTLILGGDSTYTGTTRVTGGRLAVNGSIASDVVVGANASLGGSGTIAGAITHNGTLAPGNSIGTLTITGSLTQGAGSTYQVEIDGAGGGDRVNVTGAPGTATIQPGATVSVQPASGAYARSTTYTILNAVGGVTGTYSGVTQQNLAFLAPSLSYDANNVFLTVDVRFARGAQTPNQAAVGRALDQANSGSMSSDMAGVIAALSGLGTAQGAAALAALSGQSYAGFGTVAVQGAQTFMNAFSQQAGGGQGGGSIALAEACDVACDVMGPRWGAWGGGVGAFGTVAGSPISPGLTYNLGGFAAGLDYRFAPNLVAGIAAGYNAATLYPQGASGQGNVGTVQFALYGEVTQGAAYLDALAGYAHSDNRQMRQIIIPGLNQRTAWGQTTADQVFGQLEAGYKLAVAPAFGGFVTPFARLQASTSTQAAFTESGANALDLSVAAQTTNSLRTVLGAQLGAAIDAGWRDKLNTVFRLGWSHEFADLNRPVSASFAGAPAATFTTQGATAPRDGVVLGLGANTAIGQATSLYLRYDGELAGGNTNHTLSAGVRMVW